MKNFWILCCIGLIFSCSRQQPVPSSAEGPGKSPQKGAPAAKPMSNPVHSAKVGKTTLWVENDTRQSVTFNVRWGDYQPFRVSYAGKSESHALDGCTCDGDGKCRNRDQPPVRNILLEPGKTFSFEWKGTIVVWNKSVVEPRSRYCVNAALPAGSYRISVCTSERKCAGTEAKLPSPKPVVIKLSTLAAPAKQ